MTGRDAAPALVGWLAFCGALGALVAARGDWQTALMTWLCGLAVPAVVWWCEVRDGGS